jgi:hypothetical protein
LTGPDGLSKHHNRPVLENRFDEELTEHLGDGGRRQPA